MKERIAMAVLTFLLVLTLASVPALAGVSSQATELENQMLIAQCIEPPLGVVSWWTGDGHCRDVAGVNPGWPSSGTTFAPGVVRDAFCFEGEDAYVSATTENLEGLQTLTIEAWVLIDDLAYEPQRFVSFIGSKAVIRHDGANALHQLHFYLNFGGAPWEGLDDLRGIRVNDVLYEDIWYHVAGTYDGSIMKLYLDGELVGEREEVGTLFDASGVELSWHNEPLDGLLDEVTIYNRALDESEIQAIYNAGSDGKCRPQDIVRDPEYLNLGVVDIGDHSKGIVTVTNEGDHPLTIFEAELLPWSCEDLSISLYSDQVNDITSGMSMGMGIGIPGSLFQSFVPTTSPLIAASIRLRAGGSFPDTGYQSTIKIRADTWDGPVLATAEEFIPGPVTVGNQMDVLFQFLEEVYLTPGATYFLEWVSPLEGVSWLSWMASDENPYPGGSVFNHLGDPYEIRDFVFTTYVPPDVMCDQSNLLTTGLSIGIGLPGSLYQSFVPTENSMIATSIRLRAGGTFPDIGLESSINIRSGSCNGPVLATASEYINGPLYSGQQIDKLYRFPDGVDLTPGETYFIEWISPPEGGTYLSWMASDQNPYPDGSAYGVLGTPIDNTDFVFATYLPIVLLPGEVFKIGITYTPTFIGECSGELVIFNNDPGEHVIYVQMSGRSTMAYSPWIEYPVFLDGQISYENEWADTEPVEVRPRRAWGWPNKMTEDTDISYYARFKNDDEWLYLLYEATWASAFSPPEGATVSMFFFEGNPNTNSDSGSVDLSGGTWDPFGWNGGSWTDDLSTPTGTLDVEGTGYFDGTTYWFEFRKRLDSGDGYDWSFKPGDLMGNRINPWAHPNMLVALWDVETHSTYEQNIAIQLSTLSFNAQSLNTQMLRFQQQDNVIHLFNFDDVGTEGQPPAIIRRNQPIVIGFEWIIPGGTPAEVDQLRDEFIDNPNHKFWVTIDGSDSISIKSWYQEPFYTETRNGPRWKWDHDGDGPGDRDGDGIGDWIGPVLFFRYQPYRLAPGTHTLTFTCYVGPGLILTDTVTVIVR
ncbi:MAG: LamG-like jellyroll fold domain-containing protein [Candidatus Thorarchaeota archaeon]